MNRTVAFSEVALWGTRSGVCACSRKSTRRRKFWQTISPFNNKSRREIYQELGAEVSAWEKRAVQCKRCEDMGESPVPRQE